MKYLFDVQLFAEVCVEAQDELRARTTMQAFLRVHADKNCQAIVGIDQEPLYNDAMKLVEDQPSD